MQSILIIVVLILLYLLYDNHKQLVSIQNQEDTDIYMNIDMKNICDKACEPKESQKIQPAVETTQIQPTEKEQQRELVKSKVDAVKKQYKNMCDVDFLYDDSKYYYDGDTLLANKAIQMNKKAKENLDNRAIWNVNSFLPYVEKELRDAANCQSFWDDDSLEKDF